MEINWGSRLLDEMQWFFSHSNFLKCRLKPSECSSTQWIFLASKPVSTCDLLYYDDYNRLVAEDAFIYGAEWSKDHSRCADGHRAYQLGKHSHSWTFLGHRPVSQSEAFASRFPGLRLKTHRMWEGRRHIPQYRTISHNRQISGAAISNAVCFHFVVV